MSRHEDENVDSLNLPDPLRTSATYYTTEGVAIDRTKYDNMKHKPRIYAKQIQHKSSKVTTYFILYNDHNKLFNPYDTADSRRMFKFRRVNQATFEMYVKFLKHKYTSLLVQAERGL